MPKTELTHIRTPPDCIPREWRQGSSLVPHTGSPVLSTDPDGLYCGRRLRKLHFDLVVISDKGFERLLGLADTHSDPTARHSHNEENNPTIKARWRASSRRHALESLCLTNVDGPTHRSIAQIVDKCASLRCLDLLGLDHASVGLFRRNSVWLCCQPIRTLRMRI